ESVAVVAGCACYERGCWFARATVEFVVSLHVRVGVSRRLREPTCGVAFTGAGLWPTEPVEVGIFARAKHLACLVMNSGEVLLEFFSVGSGGGFLSLGQLLSSLKSSTVLPHSFEVFVVWLVTVALPSRLRCIAWLPCVLGLRCAVHLAGCSGEFSHSGALVVLVEVLPGPACVASAVLLAAVFSLMVRVVRPFGLCVLVKAPPRIVLLSFLAECVLVRFSQDGSWGFWWRFSTKLPFKVWSLRPCAWSWCCPGYLLVRFRVSLLPW
ncbi:hypothetical protein Taro_008312, partial [Colocasia esculenta]|nr:hypothetical protein [Colocasia esculenta]